MDPSPIRQLEACLRDAIAAKHPEPTAMTLATVSEDGTPAARIVLLKKLDDEGLGFYTNYESEKGRHLSRHPRACATFFWVLLERQVRVTGAVTKMTPEASDAYFRSRPRESQLATWASRQSTPLSGRQELDRNLEAARARFGDGDVPRPPYWGGYVLRPERVEFWQGGTARLHDRLVYTRISESADAGASGGAGDAGENVASTGERWQITRLAP